MSDKAKNGKDIHAGRIGKGLQGGKSSSGAKVGHKEHGTVRFYHNDALAESEKAGK